MIPTWFHVVAGILLTICVFCFALSNYYGYIINLELRGQLPHSRWSAFRAWSSPIALHRKYCPDSQARKKCLFCAVGMLVCGYLGFFFWMK
jgi:hypothetical protein